MIRSKNVFLEVFNSNMEPIGQIHEIVSLKWTVAFRDIGSFELTCIVDDLSLVLVGNFLARSDTSNIGYISEVNISRDINGVKTVSLQGIDALDILNQRINHSYGYQENIYLWEGLNRIITYNTQGERAIPFLNITALWTLFLRPDLKKESFTFARETLYVLIMQLLPDNFDIVAKYRKEKQWVPTVHTLDDEDPEEIPVYNHFIEVQLSIIASDAKPYIFSDKIGNINAWSWYQDINSYKNVAYVMGEGEGSNRTTLFVGEGYTSTRRELGVDARDLSRDTEDGRLTVDQYITSLRQRGIERLQDTPNIKEVSLEISEAITADWLGSQAYCETEVFVFEGLISAITEIFDLTGYSIFPTISIKKFIRTIATEDYIDITTEDGDVLTT